MEISNNAPHMLFQSVVEEFKTGIFNCNMAPPQQAYQTTVAMFSMATLPLSHRHKTLDLAIFCSLTLYLGKMRDDNNLIEIAHAAYPLAIHNVRQQLSMAVNKPGKLGKSAVRDVMLGASMGLQLYEVCSDVFITSTILASRLADRANCWNSSLPMALAKAAHILATFTALSPCCNYQAHKHIRHQFQNKLLTVFAQQLLVF